MIIDDEVYLKHYGILRKSGRYPWGSGNTQDQRNRTFIETIDGLRKQGLSETEIAKGFDITTTQLRAAKTIAKQQQKQAQIMMAQRLKDRGHSNVAIGKRMGIPESSVRALLNPETKRRNEILVSTSDVLKQAVAEKKYVDIGAGVEHNMNISETKLAAAVAQLREQGYEVHKIKVPQLTGSGNLTEMKVLAPPGTTQKDVWMNRANIQQVQSYSQDGGRTYSKILPPISVDSKRVGVRYAEQGGTDADGVIYVRRGVKDLSLGKSNYAQVRVLVDGTHYLKGMAMYRDDLPAGTDLLFNTNKSDTGNKLDAMKPAKEDSTGNPFGSFVRQIGNRDENGKLTKVTSAMNLVNEEGDWGEWSKTLSSQFLSKQSPFLAKAQLDKARDKKREEFDEIMAYTNPAVRKKLLESFADGADSSAVHLKAASLPNQANHVILPINSLKPTEIYAPNYNDGDRVVLIRHPHGGIFEIPELVVNNRHPDAKRLLGNAPDAVGINHKVAEQLSGADFDGDTVLVIPNNDRKVNHAPILEGLKNFDPQMYKIPKESDIPRMTARVMGQQMGKVSNLITDMTIQGAPLNEIVRAVRHSMVVIDAKKHELDWKQSSIDHSIPALMKQYQNKAGGGAATLISKASSRADVNDRKLRSYKDGGPIDPETGKLVYVEKGTTRTVTKTSKRTGEVITKQEPKKIQSKKLAETDDAHTLSSGTPIERIYADYSNSMKSLANEARKQLVRTEDAAWSPSAKAVYSEEVTSLNAKLTLALKNAPHERQAQVIANAQYRLMRQGNPDMDDTEIKKQKALILDEARSRVGAGKKQIKITPEEWAAIQAGAISKSKLEKILDNADMDVVKKLATPSTKVGMTATQKNRAEAMLRSGAPWSDVARALGISVSALKIGLSEQE